MFDCDNARTALIDLQFLKRDNGTSGSSALKEWGASDFSSTETGLRFNVCTGDVSSVVDLEYLHSLELYNVKIFDSLGDLSVVLGAVNKEDLIQELDCAVGCLAL